MQRYLNMVVERDLYHLLSSETNSVLGMDNSDGMVEQFNKK